jgi:hypothetical protein
MTVPTIQEEMGKQLEPPEMPSFGAPWYAKLLSSFAPIIRDQGVGNVLMLLIGVCLILSVPSLSGMLSAQTRLLEAEAISAAQRVEIQRGIDRTLDRMECRTATTADHAKEILENQKALTRICNRLDDVSREHAMMLEDHRRIMAKLNRISPEAATPK